MGVPGMLNNIVRWCEVLHHERAREGCVKKAVPQCGVI